MVAKDVESQKKMQEIANRLSQIAVSLQDLANLLSEEKTVPREEKTSLAEQLKIELGANLQYVDVTQGQSDIRIRPKKFLGTEVFRSISDVARKQRGRWDGGQRCFIIPMR